MSAFTAHLSGPKGEARMSDAGSDWLDAYEGGALQEVDLSTQTQVSVWTAMGGLLCASAGPFSSYLIALPLSCVSIWSAWKVINARIPFDDQGGRSLRAVSYAGLVGGIFGLLISGFIIGILVLVLLMYAFIFLLALVGAAAGA